MKHNPCPASRVLGGLLFLLLALPAAADLRTFTDRQGREIEAEITRVSGPNVTLKLANGRAYTMPVAKLSDADQLFVAAWKADPKSVAGGGKGDGGKPDGGSAPVPSNIAYSFEFEVDKERVRKGSKKRQGPGEVVAEDWVYEIELENRSKATLEGLEISYRIYVDPKATAKLDFDAPPKFFGYRDEVETIKDRAQLTLTTQKVTLNELELDGNYTFTDGSRNKLDDDLEGIWIKLWHGGKKVAEFKDGNSTVKKAEWPDNEPADPKAEEDEAKDGN